MAKTLREAQLAPLLKQLNSKQLASVCNALNITKPRGTGSEGFFSSYHPPSKSQYIKKILESNVDTEHALTYLHSQYALSGSRLTLSNAVVKNKGGKKKIALTLKKRRWIWDHPQAVGITKVCNVCHQRITRFEDMELDHIKAKSKGGVTMAMTHKDCNRMKSSGSLKEIQRTLGIR